MARRLDPDQLTSAECSRNSVFVTTQRSSTIARPWDVLASPYAHQGRRAESHRTWVVPCWSLRVTQSLWGLIIGGKEPLSKPTPAVQRGRENRPSSRKGDVRMRPRINRSRRISGHSIEGLLQFPVEWRRYGQPQSGNRVFSIYVPGFPDRKPFSLQRRLSRRSPGFGVPGPL